MANDPSGQITVTPSSVPYVPIVPPPGNARGAAGVVAPGQVGAPGRGWRAQETVANDNGDRVGPEVTGGGRVQQRGWGPGQRAGCRRNDDRIPNSSALGIDARHYELLGRVFG